MSFQDRRLNIANSKLMQGHKDIIYALFIFLFSLILRLIYLAQMRNSPFFLNLGLDPQFYMGLASKINKGQLFPEGIFWYHPFFPYFLAFLNKAFQNNLYAIRLAQHTIGSLSCVLVYYLAKDFLGRKTAVIASFITASYGFIIFSEFTLESDYLTLFFCLIVLLLISRSYKKFSYLKLFFAGLTSAVFMLTRANILPILTVFWIIWDYRKINFKAGIVRSLVFMLGFIMIIGATSLMAYLKTKHFMIIGAHGGINFYVGNGPFARGVNSDIPFVAPNTMAEHDDFLKMANFLTGRNLEYVEASNFWLKMALKYIASNPLAYAGLLVKKFDLFCQGYEIPDNMMNYYFTKEHYSFLLRFLPFEYRIIFPLSVIGMILGYPLRRRLSLLYLYIIGYVLFLMQFSIRARYRLPIVPLLIIFAAHALYQLWAMLRVKDNARFFTFFILFIMVFFLFGFSNIRRDYDNQYFNLAYIYYNKHEYTETEKNYIKAVQINPKYLIAWENLGMLYLMSGKYENAENCFDIIIKFFPYSATGWYGWAVLQQNKNNTRSAIKGYENALQIKPAYADALRNLAGIYYNMNDLNKGNEYFKEAIKIDPNSEKMLKFERLKAEMRQR